MIISINFSLIRSFSKGSGSWISYLKIRIFVAVSQKGNFYLTINILVSFKAFSNESNIVHMEPHKLTSVTGALGMAGILRKQALCYKCKHQQLIWLEYICIKLQFNFH